MHRIMRCKTQIARYKFCLHNTGARMNVAKINWALVKVKGCAKTILFKDAKAFTRFIEMHFAQRYNNNFDNHNVIYEFF